MNQFLVLRLSNPISWVIVGSDGGRLGPVATGDFADAAPVARERQVVAVAPGASVTLARPELPVKAGAKIAQVVPYAMEESLAGEVEQFHFAIGATDEAGSTEVAAVRREELRGWLDALAAAGIEPSTLVPDTLCMPENPGKTVVVLDSGQLLVRAPGGLPVALDAEPLTEAFALAGLEGEDRHVQLFVAQQDWQHSREMIEALREVTGSLDLQILPDGALPLIASGAVRPGTLSLLQGEFVRRTGWRAEWLRWRVAALLAIAALVLFVGVRGYDLVRLHAEQRRLDAAIEQAARVAMPDVERIEDARTQVEQRLAGAGANDPQGLLNQLAAVGGALAGAPGPRLESLGWRDRALELGLIAPDTDSIARFAQGINERGLAADVTSTTNSEQGIQAQVRIGAGAPGMKLRDWYYALPEREQRTVLWGGAAAAVLLFAALVWQLGASVTATEERVERRRQDLAFIEAATPILQTMPASRPGESLTIAVDRMAREGGLSEQLAGTEPAANGALRARFTAASFDSLMLLLARLQKERGAHAETASVSATDAPGLVDATIVIRGP